MKLPVPIHQKFCKSDDTLSKLLVHQSRERYKSGQECWMTLLELSIVGIYASF